MNKKMDIPEKERAVVLQGGDLLVPMRLERTGRFTNLSLKKILRKEGKGDLHLI